MNGSSQIINAGEMTVVRLERAEYTTEDDISGTVELSNYRNKEITSVVLEISTWRHISSGADARGGPKKATVEQLYRQTLDLFPTTTADGGRHSASDEKVLRSNAMFAFTFSATTPKPPTIDFLEHGRIKHYMTCYVYKKSGLLNRPRLVEKNQFQIAVRPAAIDVDTLFPDRTFSCLESRPHSSNPPALEFRSRCNRHLMPGLPFLLEIDFAKRVRVQSITVSLHQRIFVAVGTEEREHSYTALYVHQSNHPQPHVEGHFRDRDSSKPLAYGRQSYLLEWVCPDANSQHKLPFRQTLYTKTDEGNIECGLTLKVEVTLADAAQDKIAAVIHQINYQPLWVDARPNQTTSLRAERSITSKLLSSSASQYSGSSSRRPSTDSIIGTPTIISHHLHSGKIMPMHTDRNMSSQYASSNGGGAHTAVTLTSGYNVRNSPSARPNRPLPSPSYQSPSNMGGRVPPMQDYFDEVHAAHLRHQSSINHNADLPHEVKFANAPYSPMNVDLFRTDATAEASVQTSNLGKMTTTTDGSRYSAQKPDQITLPPASVRSSMSSAFESLQLHQTQTKSPIFPSHDNMPTPPPTHPLPAAPVSEVSNTPFGYTSHPPSHINGLPSAPFTDERRPPSRQKKLSRPPVILGISQETIQRREHPDAASPETCSSPYAQSPVLGTTYDAVVRRGSNKPEYMSPDCDCGYPDASASRVANNILNSDNKNHNLAKMGAPVSTTGFARPRPETSTNESVSNDGGRVLLG